ncbi:MAG: YlxR family protein [Oscillospiraceae bacterium]
MQKVKKVPQRMCSGCGEHKDKKELIRIVKSPTGEISLDLTGKMQGRGAYICPLAACLAKAKKAKRLERVFSSQIPEEVYNALESELSKI